MYGTPTNKSMSLEASFAAESNKGDTTIDISTATSTALSEPSGSEDEDESGSESDDSAFADNKSNTPYTNPFPTTAKPFDPSTISYTYEEVIYTLPLACSMGNFPITVLLWGMYAAQGINPMSVDVDGNNPLHYAALCDTGNTEVVDFLFQQTAGSGTKLVDSRNNDEETPLLRAATKGNLDMIKCLVKNGADLGALDGNKNTIIANLARSGHLFTLHFVLSLCPSHVAKSIMEQNDVDEHTALDWACYKGHTNVAEYLMYRGIEPTSVDSNGRNCLHWAAKQGQSETAAYLVAIGMDVLTQDNEGSSPAMFALSNWELYDAMMLNPAAKCGYRGGATMGEDAAFKVGCCNMVRPTNVVKDAGVPGSLRGAIAPRVAKALSGLDTDAGLNPCYNRKNPTRVSMIAFFAALTMGVWAVFVFLKWWWTPITVLVLVWLQKVITANLKSMEKKMSARAGHVVKLDGPLPKVMEAHEQAIGFWAGCAGTFLAACAVTLAIELPEYSHLEVQGGDEYMSSFVFLAVASRNSPVLFAAVFGCVTAMIVSWYVLVFVIIDPGVVYTERSQTYSELLEEVATLGGSPDPRKWCTTTLVKKPMRAKYDAPTGLLVARHDHYCIWLDTAVGFGNHRVFMVFVALQVASHYLFSAFGWINIVKYLKEQEITDACDVVGALASQRMWGVLVLTLCANVCALSLSFLLGQQVGNLMGNITTNERINSSRYPWLLDDEGKRFVNRYDTGSTIANCKEFWGKTRDYRRTYDLPPVRAGHVFCSDGCCEPQAMTQVSGGGHGHDHAHGHGHGHGEDRV